MDADCAGAGAAEELTAAQVKTLTEGCGVDLAFAPIGGRLFIDCLHALAPLGTAISYNVVAGPPSEDVFKVLRSLLGRSLAVRCFSMHTFDEESSPCWIRLVRLVPVQTPPKSH